MKSFWKFLFPKSQLVDFVIQSGNAFLNCFGVEAMDGREREKEKGRERRRRGRREGEEEKKKEKEKKKESKG